MVIGETFHCRKQVAWILLHYKLRSEPLKGEDRECFSTVPDLRSEFLSLIVDLFQPLVDGEFLSSSGVLARTISWASGDFYDDDEGQDQVQVDFYLFTHVYNQ